jgi:hypothetical protein
MSYSPKTKEKYRKIVIEYIKNNKKATHRSIIKNTKIKIPRVFENGLKEAFIGAGVPLTKALSKRSRKQQKKEVIEYIKKNPNCTIPEILRDTRVTIPRVFGSIVSAYDAAGVEYKRKKNKQKESLHSLKRRIKKIENKSLVLLDSTKKKKNKDIKVKKERNQFIKKKENKKNKTNYKKEIRKIIIKYIQKYPLKSIPEIAKDLKLDIYSYFKNINCLYKEANIPYISGHQKRVIKKQHKIIDYIKTYPNSTQWEINKMCKTHVQEIFKGGIKEAYKKANVGYPKDRKIYGIANKNIRKRAQDFENGVINLFREKYYTLAQYKNSGGIADAIIEINGQLLVIEVKDYKTKPISLSDIKQLNRYIDATEYCNVGLLITREKDKKENIYIGNNRIFIRTINELTYGMLA